MPFVVTDKCQKDFRCVDECGIGAISPRSGDPAAQEVSQVFIDPEYCLECGACAGACEFDAIKRDADLTPEEAHFAEKNAEHFRQ
jgi:ferredoxin